MIYYDTKLKVWIYDDNIEQYAFDTEAEAMQYEMDQKHPDFKTYRDYCKEYNQKPGHYLSLKIYMSFWRDYYENRA
jgi:hypothetical protein